MPAEDLPVAGTQLTERYRIDWRIARGGVGVVYRATDLEHDCPVAVKVLPRTVDRGNMRERFLREARLAAQVHHQFIVQLLDFGFYEDDRPFLVMELVDGQSLHRRLTEDGPMPIMDACTMAGQILSACTEVHRSELVHRDIKPANILILEGPQVFSKLIDFGMSKSVTDAADAITEPGKVLGTPSYMAPEQLIGQPIDARTDIYGVGACLYEALVGSPIVADCKDVRKVFDAVLKRENVPPSSLRPAIPSEVDAIVVRALDADPSNRYATAVDMMKACYRVTGLC